MSKEVASDDENDVFVIAKSKRIYGKLMIITKMHILQAKPIRNHM